MKNIVIGLAVVLSLSGCVTRKIPVKQEAKEVTPITEISAIQLKCELIEVYTLEDSHPNNVVPVLKKIKRTFLVATAIGFLMFLKHAKADQVA